MDADKERAWQTVRDAKCWSVHQRTNGWILTVFDGKMFLLETREEAIDYALQLAAKENDNGLQETE